MVVDVDKPRVGLSVLCPYCSSRLVKVQKGLFKRHTVECKNNKCGRRYFMIRRLF